MLSGQLSDTPSAWYPFQWLLLQAVNAGLYGTFRAWGNIVFFAALLLLSTAISGFASIALMVVACLLALIGLSDLAMKTYQSVKGHSER